MVLIFYQKGTYNSSFRSNRSNRSDQSETNDPRFAGKFGNSSSDGRYGSARASSIVPNVDVINIPVLPTVEKTKDVAQIEEKKAQNNAKNSTKADEEKRQKEIKSAALAEKRALEVAEKDAAVIAINSGKKGNELTDYIHLLEVKPTGASLISVILSSSEYLEVTPALIDRHVLWLSRSEYGDALANLMRENTSSHVAALYEVQRYCKKINFPKLEVGNVKKPLVDVIFKLIFKDEIIDDWGFISWCDDENELDIPGKLDAITQTTEFINLLRDSDDKEEEEEYEINV